MSNRLLSSEFSLLRPFLAHRVGVLQLLDGYISSPLKNRQTGNYHAPGIQARAAPRVRRLPGIGALVVVPSALITARNVPFHFPPRFCRLQRPCGPCRATGRFRSHSCFPQKSSSVQSFPCLWTAGLGKRAAQRRNAALNPLGAMHAFCIQTIIVA